MAWQRFGAVPVMASIGRVSLVRPDGAIALLFDRSNFRPDRDEDEPVAPTPRRRQERVLVTLVFALLALAFVLPVSAAGLSDLVHYLGG